MRRPTSLAPVIVALALSATPVLHAQGGAPAQPTSSAPPSAGQLAAARELLRIMDVERVTMSGVDAMLNAQFGGNPALAPYVDVAREWAKKYMTWEVIGERLARVYAASFTEAELRDIIAFYHTPTGKKLAQVTPDLMRQGAEVGARVADENMPELQRMLEARRAQLEKPAKP